MAVLDIFGDGSCVALYEFENDTTDVSGNHDIVSGWYISYVDTGDPYYGYAVKQNGASTDVRDRQMQIPYSEETNNLNTTAHFRLNYPLTATGYKTIYWLNNGSSGSTEETLFVIGDGAGTAQLDWYVKTSNGDEHIVYDSIVTGEWRSIDLVKEAPNMLRIHVDGVLVSSMTTVGNLLDNTHDTYVFSDDCMGDQLRIFNRPITDAESLKLFNEHIPPPTTFDDVHLVEKDNTVFDDVHEIGRLLFTSFNDRHSVEGMVTAAVFNDIHRVEQPLVSTIMKRE